MVKLNFEPPKDFLRDEEVVYNEAGDRYTTTKQLKEVQAVELDILKEIDGVCKKYNLKYFVIGGTLLGAVRHKGFIPWDDDIDIAMMRDDYEVLLSHPEEFKEPYFLQSAYTDEGGYFDSCAKVRRSDTTGCVAQDRYQSMNNGIFVDIFVTDEVPDDEAVRKAFLRKLLRHTVFGVYFHYYFRKFIGLFLKKKFKPDKKYLRKMRQRYTRMEMFCKQYNHTGSKYCAELVFVYRKNIHVLYPVKSCNNLIDNPFNYTSVPVPSADRDFILLQSYGKDYMTPKRAPSMHKGVYFDTDVSYRDYFKKGSGGATL